MNTYMLYDTKYTECLVAMGSIKEIAKYTGATRNNILSCMVRGIKVLHRYEVAKLLEDEGEE